MEQQPIFIQQFYRMTTTDLLVLISNLKKNMNSRMLPDDFHQELTEELNRIQLAFKQGYADLDQTIKDKKAQIQQNFMRTTQTVSDPTKELLARQDYELRLGVMDVTELNKYVEDLSNQAPLTIFQVNKLKLVLKQRQSELANYSLLKAKVVTYEAANNIGKEYEISSEWQSVQALALSLVKFRDTSKIWVNVKADPALAELYTVAVGFSPDENDQYVPVIFSGVQQAVNKGVKQYADEIGYKDYVLPLTKRARFVD